MSSQLGLVRHARRIATLGLLFLALSASGACGRASAPAIDADRVLLRMSEKLAGATRVEVIARREADADLLPGRDLQPQTSIRIRLVRPHTVVVLMENGADKRAMFADGKTFTLQDIGKNLYATTSVDSTLDDLDEQLARLYGFTPPMFEFIRNHPYEGIKARISGLTYVGLAPDAAGIQCHRVSAAGDVADADLWVDATDFLPRQLIATFRDVASHPQIRLYFSSWNLSPAWSEAELAFSPPAGAVKIPMRSISEMQALMKGDKR